MLRRKHMPFKFRLTQALQTVDSETRHEPEE